MLLNVASTVGVEHGTQNPGNEREAAHGSHEHHPEPEEQIDLLIE